MSGLILSLDPLGMLTYLASQPVRQSLTASETAKAVGSNSTAAILARDVALSAAEAMKIARGVIGCAAASDRM
jgi:hypothetical protein